jgi:hypothetical protein
MPLRGKHWQHRLPKFARHQRGDPAPIFLLPILVQAAACVRYTLMAGGQGASHATKRAGISYPYK